MTKEFHQIAWDDRLERDLGAILDLAIAEDLGDTGDLTSLVLAAEGVVGRAAGAARRPGVAAGLPGVPQILVRIDPRLRWTPQAADGQSVARGDCVGAIEGPARGLLAAERILLNVLGRLSGIATLARQYVEAVAGTRARIYDTRKTTPGWRRLEKYAVRCGGGQNHRGGLDEAVLIKDNHLALLAREGCVLAHAGQGSFARSDACKHTPHEAVERARRFVADPNVIIEIEVDTLEQLDAVLPARPDIVLLDNMTLDALREAVARRDAFDRTIELEASGGIEPAIVRAVAETGVERISVGALTHSAPALDFGMDWE